MGSDLHLFFNSLSNAWDLDRYVQSAAWVEPLLTPGAAVCDMGGRSCFTDWLVSKSVRLAPVVEGNYSKLQPGEPEFDLVTCMEVIEHVKDPTGDRIEGFSFNGMGNLLGYIYSKLKPGGKLFLTTPNLLCLGAVCRMLQGLHPFVYAPHVRELAPFELRSLAEEAGFKAVRFEALRVWHQDANALRLLHLAAEFGGKCVEGNCLFTLWEKPNA